MVHTHLADTGGLMNSVHAQTSSLVSNTHCSLVIVWLSNADSTFYSRSWGCVMQAGYDVP